MNNKLFEVDSMIIMTYVDNEKKCVIQIYVRIELETVRPHPLTDEVYIIEIHENHVDYVPKCGIKEFSDKIIIDMTRV